MAVNERVNQVAGHLAASGGKRRATQIPVGRFESGLAGLLKDEVAIITGAASVVQKFFRAQNSYSRNLGKVSDEHVPCKWLGKEPRS